MASSELAVVGAGVSGLAAAATLAQAGCSVTVVERARRPGGVLGPGHPVAVEQLRACRAAGVRLRLDATAIGWSGERLTVAGQDGVGALAVERLLMAGGARPGTAAEIGLYGTRPAIGVLPAPTALALLREGVRIGERPLVLGGGHWAHAVATELERAGVEVRRLTLAVEGGGVLALQIAGRGRVRELVAREQGGRGAVSLPCDTVVLGARERPARTVAGAVCAGAPRVSFLDSWHPSASAEQVASAARAAALALLGSATAGSEA